MGQIIKSPVSVCLSVCHLSYGGNSQSILMKLYTIDRNPISKNPFVGGQNPTIPSHIFPQFFYPHNALSMGSSEHYSNYARRQIVACNSSEGASRQLLCTQCLKCSNPISLSHKPKTEFHYTSIGNAAIIQIIAKCSRYCRLLLAEWNCVKVKVKVEHLL